MAGSIQKWQEGIAVALTDNLEAKTTDNIIEDTTT